MQLPQVNGFRTLRGLGVSGEAEGHALLLGNQALLNDQQVDTKAIEAEITAQASQGSTPVLLAVDGKAVALLAVCNTGIHYVVIAWRRCNGCIKRDIVW